MQNFDRLLQNFVTFTNKFLTIQQNHNTYIHISPLMVSATTIQACNY